jgi:transposase
MKRIPKVRYTKEFKEEAVKLVVESALSIEEVGRRLSVPTSTLGYWVAQAGKGNGAARGERKPVTHEEMEVALLKREIAELKMEREILKERPRTLPKSRCPVRGHEDIATYLSRAGSIAPPPKTSSMARSWAMPWDRELLWILSRSPCSGP